MPIQQLLLGTGGSSAPAPDPLPDIITTNLVNWFDFGKSQCWDGTSTTINDLTSNNYSGTLTGSSDNWSKSNSNGGYLDLVNGQSTKTKITRNDSGLFSTIGTGAYTIEFWINIYWGEGTNTQLFKNYPTANDNARIALKTTGSTTTVRMSPKMAGASGWTYFSDFGEYSSGFGGWQHWVFSRSGTGANNMKGYINNQLKDTWTQPNNFDESLDTSLNNSGFSLGDDGTTTYLIARFAVYRLYVGKGLTASEVEDNYDAEKQRFGLS